MSLDKKPQKTLVDTGSTRSFIHPKVARTLFPTLIQREKPYLIKTACGESKQDETLTIKLPHLKTNEDFKFHLFNFHEDFDVLLGNDNMKKLKCSLDYNTDTVNLGNLKFFIKYKKNPIMLQKIEIEPYCERVVKVPVKNIKNGCGLIPHIKFDDETEIQEGIVEIKNYMATCQLTNNSKFKKQLQVESHEVIPIDPDEEIKKLEPNLPENDKIDLSKIRRSHMSSEERLAIEKLIFQYKSIIPREEEPLSFGHTIKHVINTGDSPPCYTKNYRYPHILKEEVYKQISEMLRQGIIRPSYSPWSSPVWIVPKKLDASGQRKWRVVIDYRKVNERTIGDKYPIPNITDILDRLGKAKYFTTLDLASGFHQIEMQEDSISKTAFSIDQGHFEFLRMPFGLKNAPPTFQRVMDHILRGYINKFCMVYLDDIIIFSSSLQEHIYHCKLIFRRLQQFNMKIQLDKCEFFRKEVAYLGHVITPDGVRPNPDKIKAIQRYKIPTTTTEIKGFLGLLGYYRKFIPQFADLTKPLTSKLKKGTKIDPEEQSYRTCFENCKKLLCNDPILAYPDFSKPFLLTTDASNVGLGAVLSQGKPGQDKPICYASRTLNESEQKLSTTEKECLAIIYGVTQFRPYLFGRRFTIYTDHQPLKWLFNLKEPNAKLMRWKLKLEEYDYNIEYKPGKTNLNADALSRQPIIETYLNTYIDLDNQSLIVEPDDENDQNLFEQIDEILENFNEDIFDEIPVEGRQENPLNENLENEQNNQTIHSNQEDSDIAGIPIVNLPVNYGKHQIVIKQLRSPDPDPKHRTKKCFDKLRLTLKLPENDLNIFFVRFVKTFCDPNLKYCLYFENPQDYILISRIVQENFSKLNFVRYTKLLEDVYDETDQIALVSQQHDGLNNHRGIQETLMNLRLQYFWPKMENTVARVINNCELCQKNKYERNPIKTPLEKTPTADAPMKHLVMDIFHIGNCQFLTLIDTFSKFGFAIPIQSKSAICVAEALEQLFSTHRIPEKITADSGSEFGNLVKETLRIYRIDLHITCVGHHKSTGDIERLHSTLIEHFRLLKSQPEFSSLPTVRIMYYALMAYNNSFHSCTKLIPRTVLYPDDTILKDYHNLGLGEFETIARSEELQALYKLIEKRIENSKETRNVKFNKGRKQPEEPNNLFYKTNRRNKIDAPFAKFEKVETLDRNRILGKNPNQNINKNIHLEEVKPKRRFTSVSDGDLELR